MKYNSKFFEMWGMLFSGAEGRCKSKLHVSERDCSELRGVHSRAKHVCDASHYINLKGVNGTIEAAELSCAANINSLLRPLLVEAQQLRQSGI